MPSKPAIVPTGPVVPEALAVPIRADHADSAPSRNPLRAGPARLLSALRGDKYMVGAYPPEWQAPAPTPSAGRAVSQEPSDIAVASPPEPGGDV
jgi:hypothetical protein